MNAVVHLAAQGGVDALACCLTPAWKQRGGGRKKGGKEKRGDDALRRRTIFIVQLRFEVGEKGGKGECSQNHLLGSSRPQ